MADTRYLKTKVEEFDAVSEDGTIVCSIKIASWKTTGLKRGSGKVQGAYTELCEEQPGFGTAKALITSGAAAVYASTVSALSQESMARA
jgi:hypothetical protein